MDPLASLGGIEGAMRISDQIGEASRQRFMQTCSSDLLCTDESLVQNSKAVPCLWRAAMACAQAGPWGVNADRGERLNKEGDHTSGVVASSDSQWML